MPELATLLTPGPTRVMGIVNVTPDSFSDGGAWFDPTAAVAHGRELAAAGAEIIDVGGESTRPGIERTPAAEELRRVLPVVTALVADGIPVSVDTMRAEVADACVSRGAHFINDVSAGLADPEMLGVVAGTGAAFIAMHWRGHSATMQQNPAYADPAAEVRDELADRVRACLDAGIAPERLILDPGLGFAKTAEHNWAVLRGLDDLARLGFPLLIGASRKNFLGRLHPEAALREPSAREDAGIALTALVARERVWAVRTHTVTGHRDAIAVAEAMRPAAAARPARTASED